MNTKPTLRLRTDVVKVLREMRGLETDRRLADAMGINHGNLSRTLRGLQQPGPRFIATLCTALEASMNDLFVIEDTKDKAA